MPSSKFKCFMLGLKSHMNFYLCEGAVDMRKGIVSLSEPVRRKMHASPDTGDVFIFLGKDRRNLKILRHESNGYVLYWKKLDRERFLLPVFNIEMTVMRLVGTNLWCFSKVRFVRNFS